jgi:hypothetical protein
MLFFWQRYSIKSLILLIFVVYNYLCIRENKYRRNMTIIIEWLKAHLLTCPSKHFFHLDCPGCGMQRSMVALLEGDLSQSFQLYPATIPMLFTLLFTGLHLKFNFSHGASIIKWSYISTTSIIVIFYFYKIFTHKLI